MSHFTYVEGLNSGLINLSSVPGLLSPCEKRQVTDWDQEGRGLGMQMGTSPQIKFSHVGPDGKIYGDLICLMLAGIVCSMGMYFVSSHGVYPCMGIRHAACEILVPWNRA